MLDRVIAQIYDEALRPIGLRMTQLTLLSRIEQGDVVTPSDLSETLRIEKSTLSRNVDRMIERGWIDVLQADDGRTYQMTLSEEGRGVLEQALPAWKAAQKQAKKLVGAGMSKELGRVSESLRGE